MNYNLFTVDFNKSDHEFSPESDLESGEPSTPLKRARTLQEGKHLRRKRSTETNIGNVYFLIFFLVSAKSDIFRHGY